MVLQAGQQEAQVELQACHRPEPKQPLSHFRPSSSLWRDHLAMLETMVALCHRHRQHRHLSRQRGVDIRLNCLTQLYECLQTQASSFQNQPISLPIGHSTGCS